MIPQRSRNDRRTMTRANRSVGFGAVLLGLVCFLISSGLDGGFVGGLFQGATVALMVLGAYLLGASVWQGRRSDHELSQGKGWLPSRDDAGGSERG